MIFEYDLSFLKPNQYITLNRYTYKVDRHINHYLRNGKEEYIKFLEDLENHPFHDVKLLFSVSDELDKTESIKYIVSKTEEYINDIQSAFNSAKKTTENNKLELFRGTKEKVAYGTIKGFLSTTISEEIASRFVKMPGIQDDDDEDPISCCIYKYILDEGIPYIYLEELTESKGEKEILLPNNLRAELIREYVENYTNVFEVRLSLNPVRSFTKTKTVKRKGNRQKRESIKKSR